MKKALYFLVILAVLLGTGAAARPLASSPQSSNHAALQARPAQVPGLKPQPTGNPSGLHVDFGSLPLYFTANRGQVDGRALFYAKASRYTLWLTEEGLVFDSFKSERPEAPAAGKGPSLRPEKREGHGSARDVSRLIFLNASKHPEIVPVDETALKVNYFIGNDPTKWHTAVPTSGAVLYRNIYDRIDLKVYGIESRIEYDWIIRPGGDPRDIQFEYENVKGTRVDEAGNLLVETGFGELVHKKPAAYQESMGKLQAKGGLGNATRAVVDSAFKKIGENAYGFEVGAYEAGLELVIDPVVLAYSTYLGGSGYDYGYGIAVDGSGNAYVTGNTYSADFPTLNQYQTYQEGGYDAFVTKIDTTKSGNASLVYSTYLGGSNYDYGNGIAVDGSGNAYVTGYTYSSNFPTLNQYQTFQGYVDAFVTKIDTTKSGNASLVYSTYLGGSGADYGQGIAVDGSGNAYVTGYTYSADFPTLNQYQTFQGGRDAFVTKIDTTKSGSAGLVYSTYLGGSSYDYGYGIAVDGSGNAFVTGYTYSSNFPTLNQYQTFQGDADAFVTKIDTTKSGSAGLVYSTYLCGSGVDYGQGIAVDGGGNAYVTGYTDSGNFPTLNQYQTFQGEVDAFVAKISSNANVDIGVTKTADNLTPKVGEAFHFTVTVTNNSLNAIETIYDPGMASGLKISDLLPATLTYQSSLASKGTYTAGTGIWDIGTLANGATATLTLTVKGTSSGTVTNTASVSALNETDPVPANNTASATVTVMRTTYALTIAAGAGGTTYLSPGNYTYDEGTVVTITATPSAGYRFGSWSGAASGTANPVSVTMNGDKAVTANFIRQYTLSIAAGLGGTTSPAPGVYTYDEGTSVGVQANPLTAYQFDGWTGDASGSANPVTVVMNANKAITANFSRGVKPPLSLTAEKTTNRNVSTVETVVRLRWQANGANSGTISYRIYRIDSGQATLIASVSAGTYEYIVRGVQATKSYQFGISAVNSQGWESDFTLVTVQ